MDVKRWQLNYEPGPGSTALRSLEELCRSLPVIPRERAMAFFDAAENVSKDSREPNETELGMLGHMLFGNLMSTLAASDRLDFEVMLQVEPHSPATDVLMVQTFDPVIATLQAVARVGEDAFLTRTFMFDDIEPVKRLLERTVPIQS